MNNTPTDNQDNSVDKIFEHSRVLIINGLQQGVSYTDIAVAAEKEAKYQLKQLLLSKLPSKASLSDKHKEYEDGQNDMLELVQQIINDMFGEGK